MQAQNKCRSKEGSKVNVNRERSTRQRPKQADILFVTTIANEERAISQQSEIGWDFHKGAEQLKILK